MNKSVLSDIGAAHRDLADMWDEARVDLEANPDALTRTGYRLAWILSFFGGTLLSGAFTAILGVLVTLGAANGIGGDIGFPVGSAVFIALWVTVWFRSYTLGEDDKVDLTK